MGLRNLPLLMILSVHSSAFATSDPTSIARSIDVADIENQIRGGAGSRAANDRDCVDGPIDCRDPDISHLLMRAAIDKFKDIHFYRFGKPIRGDNDTCCHMAWRFRPKQGKETAFYKDYRSFVVLRSDNCSVTVVSIGEYHSGGNARKLRKKEEAAEAVDDTLPVVESEGSFISGKYLVYYGGGDRCKSMNHYLWSFMCMLGEARYLNRTLVMDISICLSKIHTSSGVDEEGKDFRFYFDLQHLKRWTKVVEQRQFWLEWSKWQEKHGLSLYLVEDFRVSPLKLSEVKDTLIMRKFGLVEPDNYWYRVCEAESVVERPWHMIRRSNLLMDIASAVAARLSPDFDALYVKNRENAEADIGVALKGEVERGRNLYVATKELDVSLLDPIKEEYSVHFVDEYKDLWGGTSEWSYEMKKLNDGIAVEFDGYMRESVDREVFLRGKNQIESIT